MAVGILDQHQDGEGTNFGFGQAAGVQSRGQCFTPAIAGSIGSIGFSRNKGSLDIKVAIDTASANVPDHAVGSDLYNFTIPNANVIDQFGVYDLPTPFPISVGTQYCFYLQPYTGGSYSDDYQDCHGIASGGLEITESGGNFSNENLTFHYAVYITFPLMSYGGLQKVIKGNNLRPHPFSPGIAR